ncbi:MAG: hypothetical protein A2X78_01415 [Gammaproteobacteria bacterium GWE2_37_16]|nr:MAG: hypothetical protein A2X78_01415 [Gammaproteobacteria bacterium GWE2_37_16]
MPRNIFELIESSAQEDIALAVIELEKLGAAGLLVLEHQTWRNIFLFAVKFGHCEIVKKIVEILDLGEDQREIKQGSLYKIVTAETPKSNSHALILGVGSDDKKTLIFLVEQLRVYNLVYKQAHLEVNYRNKNGLSALSFAIKKGNLEAFRYLLLHGAAFEEKEKELIVSEKFVYFNTPACFLDIVTSGNLHALRFIIRHIKTQSDVIQQTFITAANANGQNALMIAASKKNAGILPDLLTLGFNLSAQDNDEHRALFYLAQSPFELIKSHRGSPSRETKVIYQRDQSARKKLTEGIQNLHHLLPEEAKALQTSKDWFFEDVLPTDSQTGRGDIADILAHDIGGRSQDGKTSRRFHAALPRPYRSFSGERERQLLRHISTQVYFQFKKSEVKDLVEVEAMHLEFNGKGYLFIGVNKWSASAELTEIIKDNAMLKKTLLHSFHPHGHEGRERSKRYASKFKERVFNEQKLTYFQDKNTTDSRRAQNIAKLLRNGEVRELLLGNDSGGNLNFVRDCLNMKDGSVFLVKITTKPDYEERHIEEFFTDIVEYAQIIASEQKLEAGAVYSCVGGKKRPCMGCFGRMDGVITKHGQHPGLFWKQTLQAQLPVPALRTIDTLLTQSPCVSLRKNGKEDAKFDSGSDSEPEERAPRRH